MNLSDALTFAGIIVSIIFGFFVTHYYSVRDSRTRVLKDYYIEQIKVIKRSTDGFFHKVTFGRSSFKNVVSWYEHIRMDIDGLDHSLREHLDLQIEEISERIQRYYDEITSWEDFNNQFTCRNYLPSIDHKQRLSQIKQESDEFINNFINHVNQAYPYPVWIAQKRRIINSYRFYKEKGRIFPMFLSVWERFEKHLFEILFFTAIILISIFLVKNIRDEDKADLVTPLQNISNRQDSIHKEMQLLREKYKPVEIQSKTFKNSSFFNAEKVDSVQIKLYQGIPQE